MQAPMYCEDEVAMASKVTTGISVRLCTLSELKCGAALSDLSLIGYWPLPYIMTSLYVVILIGK